MKKYLMGIDSGTQSTRAIIFDTEGTMISEASVKHAPLIFGEDGGIYMDEKNVWDSLCEATRKAMAGFKEDKSLLCGIGLSPHNGTVCFMKKDGSHVLHPCGRARLFEKTKLFSFDRANRTSISTSAAADALISVDLVLGIALGNSANRTCACACAAGNAAVTNYVCHK